LGGIKHLLNQKNDLGFVEVNEEGCGVNKDRELSNEL